MRNIFKVVCLVISVLYLAGCGEVYYLRKMNEAKQNGDDKAWVEYLEKAAGAGHVKSQNKISKLYLGSFYLKQNYKKSLYWAKRSADNNDIQGIVTVGGHYQHGWGVKKDLDKAEEWYMKGADTGHKYGIGCLIFFYFSN